MSSSNCPPQLHLTLPANTTSFKRSFEQFGFDLESPVGGPEAGSSGSGSAGTSSSGNDRNKRARSASSLQNNSSSSSSSSSSPESGSNGENETGSSISGLSATRPETNAAHLTVSIPSSSLLPPPRLPTPDIDDVEMMTPVDSEQSPLANISFDNSGDSDHYRALQRFNEFDSEIAALRRSRSPSLHRSATPPPTLPPLSLSSLSDEHASLNTPYLYPPSQPSPPLPESYYGRNTQDHSEELQRFRSLFSPTDDIPPFTDLYAENFQQRLSSALNVIRPSSPLLRDLDDLRPSVSQSEREPLSASSDNESTWTQYSERSSRPSRPSSTGNSRLAALARDLSDTRSPRESTFLRRAPSLGFSRWLDGDDSDFAPRGRSSDLSTRPSSFSSLRDLWTSEGFDVRASEQSGEQNNTQPTSRYVEHGLLDPRETIRERIAARENAANRLWPWAVSDNGPIADRDLLESNIRARAARQRAENIATSTSLESGSSYPRLPLPRRRRFGSSGSLLAESGSELRRRAERADLMRQEDASLSRRSPVLPPLILSDYPSSESLGASLEQMLEETAPERSNAPSRRPSNLLPPMPRLFATRGPLNRPAETPSRLFDSLDDLDSSRARASSRPILYPLPTPRPSSFFSERLGPMLTGSPDVSPSDELASNRGFFDSQYSTLSEMAQTITDTGGDLDTSESETSPTDEAPPSIPLPDLGGMFIPVQDLGEENPRMMYLTPTGRVGESNSFDAILSYRPPTPPARPATPPPSIAPPPRRYIDLDSYLPGPFRNTLAHVREPAPSIPPLSFEDAGSNFRNTTRGREQQVPHQSSRESSRPDLWRSTFATRRDPPPTQRSTLTRPVRASSISYDFMARQREQRDSLAGIETLRERLNREAREESSSRPRPSPQTSTRIPPSLTRSRQSAEETHRRLNDVHELLSRQVRIEASRLDTPSTEPSQRQNTEHRRQSLDGFHEALEVLRADGLSESRQRQLVSRFRENEREERERRLQSSTSSSTAASAWTRIRPGRASPPTSASWSERPLASNMTPASLAQRRDQRRVSHDSATSDRAQRYMQQFIVGELGRSRARGFRLGDFVRDEDFDNSFEGLTQLSSIVGDAKPRATPQHIVTAMDTAFYKDWATSDSDQRCPICLDDYKSLDPVLKLPDCSHWLHKECLQQWLKGASTCPVCRKAVKGSNPAPSSHRHRHIHRRQPQPPPTGNPPPGPSRRRDDDTDRGGPGTRGGPGRDPWMPSWIFRAADGTF